MEQSYADEFLLGLFYYEKFHKEYYEMLSATSCRRLTLYNYSYTTVTVLVNDATVAPALISSVIRHSPSMTERYTTQAIPLR